jgi:hypothetical protein
MFSLLLLSGMFERLGGGFTVSGSAAWVLWSVAEAPSDAWFGRLGSPPDAS